jgi:hypothetical protein
VTVAVVAAVTLPAVIAKFADVAPAGTATVAGTVAAACELARDTETPPLPAAALSVTVPVAEPPLVTDAGAMVSPLRAACGGFTVSGAVLLLPPLHDAVSITDVEVVTVPAVVVKLADVAPDGTVTVEGTVAAPVFELVSATDTPAPPAGAVRVTVPVAEAPLVTDAGATVSPLSVAAGALTVRLAVLLAPL